MILIPQLFFVEIILFYVRLIACIYGGSIDALPLGIRKMVSVKTSLAVAVEQTNPMIARHLGILMGLIVTNDIRHVDDTVLTEDRCREQEEVLHTVVKKNKNKGEAINFKKAKYIFVCNRKSRSTKEGHNEQEISNSSN